jgi:hypothetical protein
MIMDKVGNINIRDTIAIRKKKGLPPDIRSNPLNPTAGHRIDPCVDQRHLPWLGVAVVYLYRVMAHIERNITHVKKVVGKVLFDHISFEAEANHEFIIPVMRVDLHDMPEDGLASDLDHGFGSHDRLFADSCSQAPCQDYHLHAVHLC